MLGRCGTEKGCTCILIGKAAIYTIGDLKMEIVKVLGLRNCSMYSYTRRPFSCGLWVGRLVMRLATAIVKESCDTAILLTQQTAVVFRCSMLNHDHRVRQLVAGLRVLHCVRFFTCCCKLPFVSEKSCCVWLEFAP